VCDSINGKGHGTEADWLVGDCAGIQGPEEQLPSELLAPRVNVPTCTCFGSWAEMVETAKSMTNGVVAIRIEKDSPINNFEPASGKIARGCSGAGTGSKAMVVVREYSKAKPPSGSQHHLA
jgi:hypothetical protein